MKKKNPRQAARLPAARRKPRPRLRFLGLVAVLALTGAAARVAFTKKNAPVAPAPAAAVSGTPVAATNTPAPLTNTPAAPAVGESKLEINQSVMVTVDLDFPPPFPTVQEVLGQIERRSQPEDGRGRTFAILDARGTPAPGGAKLRLSMHVSAEKPGAASLVLRPSGRELWRTRVTPGTNAAPFTGKNLSILLDDGAGHTYMVDGSGNPATVMDAPLRGTPTTVGDFWPEGAEREVTFIYSACGCPVKVKARRVGLRTLRTEEMLVIFPDDPAALGVISRLMGW